MKLISLILIALLINYACITKKAEAIGINPKLSAANVINLTLSKEIQQEFSQTMKDCKLSDSDATNNTKQVNCKKVVSLL